MSDDKPEFDAYADGYSGGGEVPIKRLLGPGLESWVAVKAEWLLRDLAAAGVPSIPRLLDYGCGNGVLLALLRRLGFDGALAGADVSAGMLEEAARTWSDGEPPDLRRIEGRAPFADAAFDVVVASAVFHHVPPADRAAAFEEIGRLLAPGGRAYIFEHNPLNPLTRWVVRRTPIDRNAVLLGAAEVRRGFAGAGLGAIRIRYVMFFPPALPWLRPLERGLGWLPLGGQYVVVATKSP